MKRLPFVLAKLHKPSPSSLSRRLADDLPPAAVDLLTRLAEKADTADGILDLAALVPFLSRAPRPRDIRAAFDMLPLLYMAMDDADKPRFRQFLLRLFGVLGISCFATVSAELNHPSDANALISGLSALMLADADISMGIFCRAADDVLCKRVNGLRDSLRQAAINSYVAAIDTLRFAAEAEEMLPLALSEMVEGCAQLAQVDVSQWPLYRLRDVDAHDLEMTQKNNAFMPLLPCLLWALELA